MKMCYHEDDMGNVHDILVICIFVNSKIIIYHVTSHCFRSLNTYIFVENVSDVTVGEFRFVFVPQTYWKYQIR